LSSVSSLTGVKLDRYSQFLLKSLNKLQFIGRCPVCNTKYNESNSSLIDRAETTITVYVECVTCSSSVVVVIMSGTHGLVTVAGMLTDLKRDDIDVAWKKSAITLDNALEMHTHLKSVSNI